MMEGRKQREGFSWDGVDQLACGPGTGCAWTGVSPKAGRPVEQWSWSGPSPPGFTGGGSPSMCGGLPLQDLTFPDLNRNCVLRR